MWIRPLLQFSHLPRAGPVLLTLLFFPLVPSCYRVLCGSVYSFLLVRYFCLLPAGVLHALLCLKVYSWCICGERCTPRPPTPLPSCSPSFCFWLGLLRYQALSEQGKKKKVNSCYDFSPQLTLKIFIYFNWRLITLQYCGGFSIHSHESATAVSPHPKTPSHLPPHPIPLGRPSAPALSALFNTLNVDWSSISHMVVYMFQCYSLKSSHPRLLPQSPKVCSFICVSFTVSHIGSLLPSF